jgi:hypothetical protein
LNIAHSGDKIAPLAAKTSRAAAGTTILLNKTAIFA